MAEAEQRIMAVQWECFLNADWDDWEGLFVLPCVSWKHLPKFKITCRNFEKKIKIKGEQKGLDRREQCVITELCFVTVSRLLPDPSVIWGFCYFFICVTKKISWFAVNQSYLWTVTHLKKKVQYCVLVSCSCRTEMVKNPTGHTVVCIVSAVKIKMV